MLDAELDKPTRRNGRWDSYCSCSAVVRLYNSFRGAREQSYRFLAKINSFRSKKRFF
jgi:hypothetical protein